MVGLGVGRFVVVARRWRSLILESGSVHSVVLLTVGTLACRAIGVGPIGIGSLAFWGKGVLVVFRAKGVVFRREWLVRGGVGSAMGGVRWFGPGRDQTYVPQGEPTFRRGGGAQGRERNVGIPGAGVGRVRFEEGVQGGGVGTAGSEGVEEPLLPGRVLPQRDQALGALSALIQVLGSEKGSQVKGLVGELLPQKPASPVPTTPTHAEVVARLHELYDSEKKVTEKVETAKERLVMEAEEGMAEVDGELKGIQEQIKALLKEDEDRKERRRKEEQVGGDDMEDTAVVEEAGSSEEVGVRVEVGKRRKVAR